VYSFAAEGGVLETNKKKLPQVILVLTCQPLYLARFQKGDGWDFESYFGYFVQSCMVLRESP
jgi:hypothetical protein